MGIHLLPLNLKPYLHSNFHAEIKTCDIGFSFEVCEVLMYWGIAGRRWIWLRQNGSKCSRSGFQPMTGTVKCHQKEHSFECVCSSVLSENCSYFKIFETTKKRRHMSLAIENVVFKIWEFDPPKEAILELIMALFSRNSCRDRKKMKNKIPELFMKIPPKQVDQVCKRWSWKKIIYGRFYCNKLTGICLLTCTTRTKYF